MNSAATTVLAKIFRRLRLLLSATETLVGYEQQELVDVIFRKTKAYNLTAEWPEMNGVSAVIDFGGGCGFHYKHALSPTIRWAVVEAPAMAARVSELATDRLRFFTSVEEAAYWLGSIDVMYSNGAPQYTLNPQEVLECGLRARVMLWQRVLLSGSATERTVQTSNLIDNGPGGAPSAVKKS
jgi:putative methyltransferase (TIGR04325 family)